MKRYSKEGIDVPVGCYERAGIRGLADSFILNQLGPVIEKSAIGFIGMTVLEFSAEFQK